MNKIYSNEELLVFILWVPPKVGLWVLDNDIVRQIKVSSVI